MAAWPIDFGISLHPTTGTNAEPEPPSQVILNWIESVSSPLYQHEPENLPGALLIMGIPQQASRAAALSIQASRVQIQIESLTTSEEFEVRPTDYAHNEAIRVVISAYEVILRQMHREHNQKIPVPVVGADDVGGILISWTAPNKYLAAKFCANPVLKSYIFSEEEGAEHSLTNLTRQKLSAKLSWLLGVR